MQKVSLKNIAKLLSFSLLCGMVLVGIRSYKAGLCNGMFGYRSIAGLQQDYNDYKGQKSYLESLLHATDVGGLSGSNEYHTTLLPTIEKTEYSFNKPYKLLLGLHSSGFVIKTNATGLLNVALLVHDANVQRPSFLQQLYYNNDRSYYKYPMGWFFFNSMGMHADGNGRSCLQYINLDKYLQGIPSTDVISGCTVVPYSISAIYNGLINGEERVYVILQPLHTSDVSISVL